MKSLQEHMRNELALEARLADEISWGSTEFGMDVTAYIHDEDDQPIKFDAQKVNKIIRNGDAPHNDKRTVEKIFAEIPNAKYIYFSYYDAYGDEEEHVYGFWDKDEMAKGMQC